MKVLTFNQKKLHDSSKSLANLILKSGWQADLIIGIKTGGIYVAEPLHAIISNKYACIYNTISLSRPSTLKKKKFKITIILKKLPYILLNQLRKLEVFIFEMKKSNKYVNTREKEIILDDILLQQILSSKNILLVDDAIDTGTTILAVKNKLLSLNKNLNIKIAVLTTTHLKPYINADFSIYNRVLLRCPWAEDYKGSD